MIAEEDNGGGGGSLDTSLMASEAGEC